MRLIDIEPYEKGGHAVMLCVEENGRLFQCKSSDISTIDAVPVVRCRDCKHSSEDDFDGSWWCCRDEEREVVEGHFCGYGERRESDG